MREVASSRFTTAALRYCATHDCLSSGYRANPHAPWVIASQNPVNSKGLKSKRQVPKKLLPPENLLNRNSTATERRDER